MSLTTDLTGAFDLDHPIVSAPMANVSGGHLAAAVSEAGGLGLVGGGYGDPEWLQRELPLARSETSRAWGVGFITWSLSPEVLRLALDHEPDAVMLSFGDPRLYAREIKQAGCGLLCQVQDVAGAVEAKEAGADFIVAQGTEAGGHGTSGRSTLPLVPAVADSVSPAPVLGAGGISDGRTLAAVLALGAAGAVVGTRFYASTEALGHEWAKELLVRARGEDTRRTRVFDVVRGYRWPEPYTGRALSNRFLERWDGRERELAAALDAEGAAFRAAVEEGDFETAMVWAGEGADLIREVLPAGEIVRRMREEAERALQGTGGNV